MEPYDVNNIRNMNNDMLRSEYFSDLHNEEHVYTKTALTHRKFHITYRQIQ
jgi:hypothetical protein